jgi:hypothetical protein
MRNLAILFLLLLPATQIGQTAALPAGPSQRMQQHVNFLADDKLEGRQTGSAGERMAIDYMIEQWENMGLSPYLETGFVQPFPFIWQKYATENNTLTIDGQAISDSLFYPLSHSANGSVTGKPVAVGFGIEAPSLSYNDYADSDVQGTIAVIEISTPDGYHPHSKYVDYLDIVTRMDAAIARGAAAILFINTDEQAENPSPILSEKIKARSIPMLFLRDADLHTEAKEVQITIDLQEEQRTGHNALAWIDNGSQQTVVIGAHFDHLGYGEKASLYTGPDKLIHNGADDNASGVAMMLELARYLSNSNLTNNNYLLVAFSGEELGLYGSGHMTRQPDFMPASINYMINMDMVGRLDEEGNLAINGIGTSPAFRDAVNAITIDGIVEKTSESGIGPSDHTSFYLKDIPVIHFFTGTHEDYHKPSDDAHKLSYDGMEKVYTYICSLISHLNDKGEIAFTPTQDQNNSNTPRFTVSLGVVPDYMYQGEGMKIDGVREEKPASLAGLQAGDIVIRMGSVTVTDMMSYMKGLSMFKKGDVAEVIYLRDGKEISTQVTF